jgi:hypothetical protein
MSAMHAEHTVDGLPLAFKNLSDLRADASFDQWLAALAQSGFALLFQSQSHDESWPPEADPMGPAPAPRSCAQTRRHAILAHAEGFVMTLRSGPGVQGPDGAPNEAGRGLAEAVFHHQTNLGASIDGSRRSFGSGGTTSLGDGTSVYVGFERVSRPQGLAHFIEECHRNAHPVPLASWANSPQQPSFMHAEHGLFSPTPSACAFGGPDHAELRERFEERLKADWAAFVGALPAQVASRISATGVERELGGPPLARPDFRHAGSTQEYWESQLKFLGENWPSASDSQIMRGWSGAIDRARRDREGLTPLIFDRADERVLGGSNPFHALACFHDHPVDAKSGVEVVRRWVETQSQEDLDAWLSQRDARGRTPAGVAFEAWMRDGALGRDDAPVARVMDVFLERGWLGAPGELAQIAYDTLSPPPAHWSSNVIPAALGHASALDRVERAASRVGQDWMVPLVHADGVAFEREQAIEALAGKFGNASAPVRAFFEALALRAQTAPKPAASVACRL